MKKFIILLLVLFCFELIGCSNSSKLIDSVLKTIPPDPGEAGKATLEGIDSDNDGVRDDIERWIVLENENLPVKTKEKFIKHTKIYTSIMVNDNTSLDMNEQEIKASYCLEQSLGNDEDKYIHYLAQIGNTKERILKQYRMVDDVHDIDSSIMENIQCD
jgi:hypothetical protein